MTPEPWESSGSSSSAPIVASLRGVHLSYGKARALKNIDLDFPAGRLVGLIGPDGVGKSSLLSLIAGAHVIQAGRIEVLGGDMASAAHRRANCPRIAYMPQGLGKNLYPTLSVFENVDFFGQLFGHNRTERERRITTLLAGTGLSPFANRHADKLSGGMKQKLGLCCALIHDPDLLILDEPTTGVDPLSRRQFWKLIDEVRGARADMSVIVATAYMEEAARFDWLVAMDEGQVLATGSPDELKAQTSGASLEDAFIALLPNEKRRGHRKVVTAPRDPARGEDVAIEADGLTMRFGDFVAVDHVSFAIQRGEIFGFVGSNGCGKTTTMKMLTGLLPPSEGTARLFGQELDPHDLQARRRVGYMSQSFSLYSELTVRQNLILHARLFQLPEDTIAERAVEVAKRFDLTAVMNVTPDALPLGIRQRLSLAVAVIHEPEMLILDEPTSGVDPIARDVLWQSLIELARRDNVTIFISTHFMNEAERCDRVALMHAGRVITADAPMTIASERGVDTLEDAFILYLEDAIREAGSASEFVSASSHQNIGDGIVASAPAAKLAAKWHPGHMFDISRMASCMRRETLELVRDPLRATLALLGSLILMVVMGYGINLDVDKLTFAVMDNDHTTISQNYISTIAGSRYFRERRPITSYADLDRRMRNGDISLAVEIPPHFASDLKRGRNVEIGDWIDGSMPERGETIQGYIEGVTADWLAQQARLSPDNERDAGTFRFETRFRYNPSVKSLVAMVPAVIPLLLILIPAMLAALSVVREKELGSIINLYVTPVTRLEFLMGKQMPYIGLSLFSSLLLVAFAVLIFRIPFNGSFPGLLVGALLYVTVATSMGLLISAFVRSQVAAIFGSALVTMLPAVQFSGMIDPVSSLSGPGAVVGRIFPTTYFMVIARGTFSKALGFLDLLPAFVPLLIAIPTLLTISTLLLKKQER